jgi:succinyl-CoA synthetase beta subunit
MNIHEYQAKELFSNFEIPAPEGILVGSALEAEFAYRRLKSPICVVKAQIHAGGRGKGGGVKVVKSADECYSEAEKMLGMNLVTHQTGPEGKQVNKVYIEKGSDIVKEYYLALLVDRESAAINIMFSTEGGMDIEAVAAKTPEKIVNIQVDPLSGLRSFHLAKLVSQAGLSKQEGKQLQVFVSKLYNFFCKKDCSLLEINPLVVTAQEQMLALDAKVNFDDNALYRHKDIQAMRDFAEEDIREVEASKFNLSYIGLEGSIGCLVNGAGLAMATMDIIKHYGADPANFLDVGGGANEQQVRNAFRIILQDSCVKGIFVNIFGGIMKCDTIAKGVVAASKDLKIKVPLVVRLEGTNVEEGKKILKDSGLAIVAAKDMADGAQKIVAAVGA